MTLIVLENEAGAEALTRTLEGAVSSAPSAVVHVGTRPQTGFTGTFIPSHGRSPESILRETLGRMSGSDIAVIIDARLGLRPDIIQNFVTAASQADSGVAYMPIRVGTETIELSDTSAQQLLATALRQNLWPVACVAIRGSLIDSHDDISGETSQEILGRLLGIAAARDEDIERIGITSGEKQLLEISPKGRSSIIEAIVNASNIEELFPHHPWNTHKEESLAACFHTIAAMLIRLGNAEGAMECLRLSDELEDSPRSLALKGIISMLGGETLGAVANMVSSLQQYEQRKREEQDHYLTFKPTDMETINIKLKSGLDALNKRDNEAALKEFFEAVFSFDSFFSEYGLDSIS